jgi:leucyl-tRNA synthetase
MKNDSSGFDHKAVEAKWAEAWRRVGLDLTNIAEAKRPFYNLMMFPYPSAEGLHVGNMYAFTGSDIYGRFKRMQGYDVFEPIGLDGFGIHSENYAFKVRKHPMDQATVSEDRFYKQLHRIGAIFDWSRTVETYKPDYYHWTQWLFVQMFKHGLAYRGKAKVNWCPSCKTVLADEQVVACKATILSEQSESKDPNGRKDSPGGLVNETTQDVCERCGNIVSNRLLEQWFFRITAYAEKLLKNIPKLDWAQKVKIAQEKWIGKKEGAKILFDEIEVFTTRPDTIFGAAFVVLSPSHPLAGKVKEVMNPATKKVIPVLVDEYVLEEVGTGAIMGVPAYDDRDMAFAKKMNLPVIRGKLTDKVFGEKMVIFHLRDWLISRQRYWGPPIPMIFCESCKAKNKGERDDMPGWYPVPENQLPVLLPRIDDYKPGDDGVAPLAKHKEFYETTCPGCAGKAVRETDVSDTFLDSSWYFLRYTSVDASTSAQDPFDPSITKKWLPVHMYTGGAEHSVLHLLYSRFVTMALKDMGFIDFEEPFAKFFAHGLVIREGAKMSKSKGNIINPDIYLDKYGTDALRLYLMFMGPYSQGGDFRDAAMEGMSRWVKRVWRMGLKSLGEHSTSSSTTIHSALQKAIKKVGSDTENRHYNTAIATMMELTNLVADEGGALGLDDLKDFIKLLAPYAPFLAEELWSKFQISNFQSVHTQSWPSFDESATKEETVPIIVQVNGKHRDTLQLSAVSCQLSAEVEAAARTSEKVKKYLGDVTLKKVIFVPGKLINFVI